MMSECSFRPRINPRSAEIASNCIREPFETKADKLQRLKEQRLKNLQELFMIKQ